VNLIRQRQENLARYWRGLHWVRSIGRRNLYRER